MSTPTFPLDDIRDLLNTRAAVCLYFTTMDCAVCKSLKPKVQKLLETQFPMIFFFEIDCQQQPEVAGQFSVFTIPTVLCFFEGRETIRLARHFSMGEFAELLERPYRLLFEAD